MSHRLDWGGQLGVAELVDEALGLVPGEAGDLHRAARDGAVHDRLRDDPSADDDGELAPRDRLAGQPPAQRREPRRADRASEDVGHLGLRQVLQIPEDKNRALARRYLRRLGSARMRRPRRPMSRTSPAIAIVMMPAKTRAVLR